MKLLDNENIAEVYSTIFQSEGLVIHCFYSKFALLIYVKALKYFQKLLQMKALLIVLFIAVGLHCAWCFQLRTTGRLYLRSFRTKSFEMIKKSITDLGDNDIVAKGKSCVCSVDPF